MLDPIASTSASALSCYMRVVLDGKPLASLRTGIGHYGFELARSLAQIAPSDDFTFICPVPLAPSAAVDFKKYRRPNFHEIHFNSPRLNRYWWSLGLPLYLSGSKFDLFHGVNYELPRLRVIPTVVTIHDLSLLLHDDTHLKPLTRRARRRLPRVAQSADMIITDSAAMKREIADHLKVPKEKIAVTHLAPRSVFKPLPPQQTLEARQRLKIADEFILFVGTIEPRKNLQALIRAFSEIQRTNGRNIQLVIAGREGWLMDEFYSLIHSSELDELVRFTGYLSDEDLCALYSSCAVFVYPTLYEGFGLPPLEAMSCGAAVVTSDIPVMRESVGEAAVRVDPNSVTGLAQAITNVLENPGMREQLSQAGIEQAGRFTWERTAAQTLEVYRQVLDQVTHSLAKL